MTQHKRHNGLLPAPVVTDLLQTCYGEAGVIDFGKTCYGEVANFFWTCNGEVASLLHGLVIYVVISCHGLVIYVADLLVTQWGSCQLVTDLLWGNW